MKEIFFKKPKTLNKILSSNPEIIKRCFIMSKKTNSTGFTPWYKDKDGYWIGIIRWYGNNNKTMKLDYRDGNKKVWDYYRQMPILPKNHPIRIKLEKWEFEL